MQPDGEDVTSEDSPASRPPLTPNRAAQGTARPHLETVDGAPVMIEGVADGIVLDARPLNKGGRPRGSTNLHSKSASSIAQRLKAAGVDWVVDLAAALIARDEPRIALWMRMLPYLVVTAGHKKPRIGKHRRGKGGATRAALDALHDLENGQ